MSDHGYEQYLADLDAMERVDRELRLRVLDSAVFVEHEFLSVAALYLGAGNEGRQEVVDRLIGSWGGMRAATEIMKTTLQLHQMESADTEMWFRQVQALMQLRHRLAHGTTESWQANPPQLQEGRLGREIRWRTRTGAYEIHWIDFDAADDVIAAGRAAAIALARLVADVSRRVSPS